MSAIAEATSADSFFLLLQDQCHASQEQLDAYLLKLSTQLPETQYDAFIRKVIGMPISPRRLNLSSHVGLFLLLFYATLSDMSISS